MSHWSDMFLAASHCRVQCLALVSVQFKATPLFSTTVGTTSLSTISPDLQFSLNAYNFELYINTT